MNNKYIKNGLWLASEKILSIFGGLIITIYTARYLGPENMGIINYSLALGALLIPLSQLGSQTIIFDKVVKNKSIGVFLLKASQPIRQIVFVICGLLLLFFLILKNTNGQEVLVFLCMSFSFYFTAMDSYKPYYDGVLKSKENMIATQVGLLSSQLIRLLLVFFNMGLIFFCIPYVLNTAIPYLIKKRRFNKLTCDLNLDAKRIKKYRNFAWGAGVPLALSSFSIAVYVQVGQVILANKIGMNEVGLYGAANSLSQAWLFLPITLMTVLLSKIISDVNNKNQGYSFVYFCCSLISIIFVIPIGFFSDSIINITYGENYIEAARYLTILSVASFFVVWGYIGVRILVNLSGYSYLMKKMICMACFNIILSWFFIDWFDAIGAAYAVLITEFISATLANYFYMNKVIFKIQINSISSIFYYKKIFN
ncbi:flippase [Photobacterium damselae]|uniref:flippase n=1 Tax=Photobacterium damselae TaxID=38293 RepID=UPI000E2D1113|nr:flippase [Photobacterium damselae]RDL31289.1 hypothetical protein BC461_09245 [Photobacterium damselae]